MALLLMALLLMALLLISAPSFFYCGCIEQKGVRHLDLDLDLCALHNIRGIILIWFPSFYYYLVEWNELNNVD